MDGAERPSVTDLIAGAWITQAIHVAVRLELPQRLAAGPLPVATLAQAVGVPAPGLRRLLRALAAVGLCAPAGDDGYALTDAGRELSPDHPTSVRSWALFWGETWPAWGRLLQAVRSGKPLLPAGVSPPSATLGGAAAELTARVAPAILAAHDFAGARLIVDVGGGTGSLLRALLTAHPALRGILLEQPAVAAAAEAQLRAAGLADRCEARAADFFAEVPTGGDRYLLKHVLHDWDDVRASQVLRSCRRAMGGAARLLVIERVVPDAAGSSSQDRAVAAADLMMMVLSAGGRERTAAELAALLAEAGFALRRIAPLTAEVSLLEATPAEPGGGLPRCPPGAP